MPSGHGKISSSNTNHSLGKSIANLIAASLMLLCTTGHAGFITFHGTQTWMNEGDGLGTWYVDGNSLWQFDFIINEAATYDFSASPEFFTSPIGAQHDPYARIYDGIVREGGTIATTYFPTSLFLDVGNYAMVFGFGAFNSDEATESLYNFGVTSRSPVPYPEFDFEVTISGPGVSVPEPGSFILLMIGLVGLLIGHKRKLSR